MNKTEMQYFLKASLIFHSSHTDRQEPGRHVPTFIVVSFPSYFSHFSFIFNLLKPTGHVMHQQFNIQQLYVLPTLYLCVLYLSENKQRLVSLTA